MVIDIVEDDIELALDKLKAREDTLRLFEELSNAGGWEVDLVKNKTIWSDKLYDIYKMPDKKPLELDQFMDMLVGGYKDLAQKKIEEAIKTKKSISFIGKIKRVDEKIIDIQISAKMIFDKDQKPIKLLGYTQDITDIIDQKREKKELSYLIENSSTEIFIIDRDEHKILYANQGFCKSLRYSKDELIEVSIYKINPDFDNICKMFNDCIDSVDTTSKHKRKDNSFYHTQLHIHTIKFNNK